MTNTNDLAGLMTGGQLTYLVEVNFEKDVGSLRLLITRDPEQALSEKLVTFSGVSAFDVTYHVEQDIRKDEYIEMLLGIEVEGFRCTLTTERRSIMFCYLDFDLAKLN